jgi:hypothetical protein
VLVVRRRVPGPEKVFWRVASAMSRYSRVAVSAMVAVAAPRASGWVARSLPPSAAMRAEPAKAGLAVAMTRVAAEPVRWRRPSPARAWARVPVAAGARASSRAAAARWMAEPLPRAAGPAAARRPAARARAPVKVFSPVRARVAEPSLVRPPSPEREKGILMLA